MIAVMWMPHIASQDGTAMNDHTYQSMVSSVLKSPFFSNSKRIPASWRVYRPYDFQMGVTAEHYLPKPQVKSIWSGGSGGLETVQDPIITLTISQGSIYKSGRSRSVSISCNGNRQKLQSNCESFKEEFPAVWKKEKFEALQIWLSNCKTQFILRLKAT